MFEFDGPKVTLGMFVGTGMEMFKTSATDTPEKSQSKDNET